jgi:hypothetical protein
MLHAFAANVQPFDKSHPVALIIIIATEGGEAYIWGSENT